jgi:NAD(P)-dependent dehydrogenase (short-subunit alcohol dehydrogenase family)
MSLATEWAGHGIRLNAIAPGVIPTEGASKRLSPGQGSSERTVRTNPMGRVGRMEELQNLATFLIADGCEWLTGQTITLDGSQSHANGSNFYELRHWTDAQWREARDAIKAQNEKDRALRAV